MANEITAKTKYVVYELNRLIGSESHLTLQKVEFSGWQSNNFNTEEEAIEALIKDEKTYDDYIILRQVYLTS